MQPVDVLDGLFESAVDALQEVDFIDADNRQDVFDIGQRSFADADPRHVG